MLPKTKAFFTLMEEYKSHWEDWTNSSACLLSKKEIIVLKNFFDTGSHDLSCLVLNKNKNLINNYFQNGKWILMSSKSDYLFWVTLMEREKEGKLKYESNIERFLNSPVYFLPIKKELKALLILLPYEDYNSIGKILASYSETKLLETRNWGEKRMVELKALLKENNCLHLLRAK